MMKKTISVLYALLQRLSSPDKLLIGMMILPLLIGLAAGGNLLACDVGGNIGGCTGG